MAEKKVKKVDVKLVKLLTTEIDKLKEATTPEVPEATSNRVDSPGLQTN